MSKIIKMTPEYIDECRVEFEKVLSEMKIADGKITFTKSFSAGDRKATVYFDAIAWLKMQTLIREFNKEVAWHGVATRDEDFEKDAYYIKDILVYPQEVTGATVNTDQDKYQTWLMSQDDCVFNNLRMQGHSHVNMGVTPSAVDTTHQEKILAQLEDDMFYIFMIWNKSGSKHIKIYDLAKNVLFENNDVSVEVIGEGGFAEFLKNAKEMVKEKTYSGAQNNYYNGYNGYYSGNSAIQKTSTPVTPQQPQSSDAKKTDVKSNETSLETPVSSKRKGRRKETSSSQNGSGAQQLKFVNNYEDDLEDMYGDVPYLYR